MITEPMPHPAPKRLLAALAMLALVLPALAQAAPSCAAAAHTLNQRLAESIDEGELADILDALNASRNNRLPDKFVTKNEAQRLGWQPGRDLWSVAALRGKSIGGDRFGNREGRLPAGNWRELDLSYRGGHRGAKRLVFSTSGMRRVSVDHYQTFIEVPECR